MDSQLGNKGGKIHSFSLPIFFVQKLLSLSVNVAMFVEGVKTAHSYFSPMLQH